MTNNVTNSQFADQGSTISNSENKGSISLKKIRTETVLISFVVGFLASILASYVYEHYMK